MGAFPDGMAYVEGRAAAILNGAADHSLLDAEGLKLAGGAAADLLGLDLEEDPAIGRLDLTAEREFKDRREGVELLAAAQWVDLPWLKAGTEGLKRGVPESVTWRHVSGRSVVLRLYDKGVESGEAAPGEWLRLERQRRARKSRERTLAQEEAVGLRETFIGRELAAISDAAIPATVCDRFGAIEVLRDLVDADELDRRGAELLGGYLALGPDRVPGRTRRRREARLRQLGIALDPLAEARRRVDVAAALRVFIDSFSSAVAA